MSFLSNSDKKKIVFTLLVFILLIINIIVSALLFLDIQIIEMPETTIEIDLIEIDAKELLLQTSIEIYNSNRFEIIVDNFEVVTKTINGDEIARINIDGGSISSNSKKIFESSDAIEFKGQGYSTLASKVTGTVGVNFLGFIKKTLPIAVNIITSLGDVIEDISAPITHISINFGELTQEGIDFTGLIDIYNPNPIEMYIEDFTVEIETETGEIVGNLNVTGGTIPVKSSFILNGYGRIFIEALNAQTLLVNMSSIAGVKIAGINKSIPFSIDTRINIPRLDDILSLDAPTDAIIKSDMKATLRGFTADMTLEVSNPNRIGLIARDVIFSIYRADGDEKELVGRSIIEEAEVGAEDTTEIPTQILLPYSKLFYSRGKGFLPDALLVLIRANITVPGVDTHIWIGVSGYQDMHPFF
jgi:LEA14-like dessication related protein